MSPKVPPPTPYTTPRAKEDPSQTRPEIIPSPISSQLRRSSAHELDTKPPSRPPSRLGSPPSRPPPATKPASSHEDDLPSREKVPPKDLINMDALDQLIELEEDDDGHEFLRSMVETYFEQAKETLGSMDAALVAKNLKELSSLGHFLKGSSAALGVSKVQASCEKIQHYGELRDEGSEEITEPQALERITLLLKAVKVEYGDSEEWLKNYLTQLEEDRTPA